MGSEMPPELSQAVAEARARGPRGISRAIEAALRQSPLHLREVLASFDPAAVAGSESSWRTAYLTVTRRLKELTDDVAGKGLDAVLSGVRDLLVGTWILETAGILWHRDGDTPAANRFADAFHAAMRKIAPALPKKIKLDAPSRKILPLSEARVPDGFDVFLLQQALVEIGDYTSRPDKERDRHALAQDDWRRTMWESARIPGWERFRELILAAPPLEEIVPGRRFSREAGLALLESIQRQRMDNISRRPNVSMIACQQCGRFEGRERVRCRVCSRMFCGRCRARESELCLADYARPRYGKIPTDLRTRIAAEARALCARYRLDEHARDETFVRALGEMGVEVAFADAHPDAGEESQDGKGKWHLRLKHREQGSTKRLLFGGMARAWLRQAEIPHDPDLEAYFVDTCLGVPVEEAMSWPTP